MRRIGGIALMLAIVAAAVPAAPAPEARPLGGLESGVLLILRMNDPRLYEELKLSESQVKKIEELNAEVRQAFPPTRGLSKEERKKRTQDRQNLNKTHQEVIVKILTKKQLKRAEQIYLQRIGPMLAFGRPPVAAALKLTDEQKEKMALLRSDYFQKLRRSGGPMEQGAMQKQVEMHKKLHEEILNVLTPAQKAKWKQLIGEPFKLEPRFLKEKKKQPGQASERPALAK